MQLSTIFRRLVENGEWPVDHQVPAHEQLAAQFGVKPATVRKAIAMRRQIPLRPQALRM